MTSIFTFAKMSTTLVQYISASSNFQAYLCLRTSLDIINTVLKKIKDKAFALKEFAALPVLYW